MLCLLANVIIIWYSCTNLYRGLPLNSSFSTPLLRYAMFFCCSFSPRVTWLSIPQSLYYVLKNRVIWDLGPCFSYGSGAKKIKTNISTWPECSQWPENWTVKLLALLPLGNTVTSLLRPLFGRLTNWLYIFLYKKKPSLIRSPVNTMDQFHLAHWWPY